MKTRRAGASRICDREYYESLHRSSTKYQENNWLLDDVPLLAGLGGRSILEIGCGNGLFLERAIDHWPVVVGLDWVRAPRLDAVLAAHPALRFVEQDVAQLEVAEPFDLVVSADVLEHLDPSALPGVLPRLHACAPRGYHKIACYDDGHSHRSIFGPKHWRRLFDEYVPEGGYRIVGRHVRSGRRKKEVVVIANF